MGMHRVSVHTGVGAHMQVCTWAGMHRLWVHMGASEPIWAWDKASTPVFTVMLSNFMLVMSFTCWSEQSSPLRSGKEITANVLCIYFSVDANSFGDSIWMETKGPSSL